MRRLSIACFFLVLAGCKPAEPAVAPVLEVGVLVAGPESVPRTLELTAQAEGPREVEVRARVTGILMAQSYREGAAVQAGDLLFTIDPAPYEVALASAQALLVQEQAKSDQAESEAARQVTLLKQKAASPKEAADAQALAAAALAARDVAAAKVRGARLDLSYCEVRAPIAGFAGRLARSEGSLVSPGADGLLTTIVQRDTVWVRFGIAEQDFLRLFGGDPVAAARATVEAVLADGTIHPLPGRVNFVAPQVDPRLGTVQMRAEFANPRSALLPGQYIRVRITGRPLANAFVVPTTALLRSPEGRYVFVLAADGRAAVRYVQVDEIQGPRAVLLGGLVAGDRVVLDNLQKVRAGQPVMPRAATK